jgi:hypothetical protein
MERIDQDRSRIPGQRSAITAIVGPPMVPAP